MRTFIAVMLVSSLALGSERELPGSEQPVPISDAPIADEQSPVLAPPIPNKSVRLKAGETAPFDGRLISLEENLRRGKAKADCRGELAKAHESQLLPTAAVIAIIAGAVALGAAAGVGVTYFAMKK